MNPSASSIRWFASGARAILLLVGLATLPTVVAAPVDDPAGKAVMDATTKLNRTPHHEQMTTTAAGVTTVRELISTEDAIYFQLHGKWKRSPMTPQMMAKQEQENFQNAKVYRCEYERDESVNGEAAAVYKAHTETEYTSADAEIWISKSRGLPLRESIDMGDKSHVAISFDYASIRAPAVN